MSTSSSSLCSRVKIREESSPCEDGHAGLVRRVILVPTKGATSIWEKNGRKGEEEIIVMSCGQDGTIRTWNVVVSSRVGTCMHVVRCEDKALTSMVLSSRSGRSASSRLSCWAASPKGEMWNVVVDAETKQTGTFFTTAQMHKETLRGRTIVSMNALSGDGTSFDGTLWHLVGYLRETIRLTPIVVRAIVCFYAGYRLVGGDLVIGFADGSAELFRRGPRSRLRAVRTFGAGAVPSHSYAANASPWDWVAPSARGRHFFMNSTPLNANVISLLTTNDGHGRSSGDGHTSALTATAVYGNTLATASYDGDVKLWDLSTGACVATVREHHAPVLAVAIVDDTFGVSGGEDNMLRLWTWRRHSGGDVVRCDSFVTSIVVRDKHVLAGTLHGAVDLSIITRGSLVRRRRFRAYGMAGEIRSLSMTSAYVAAAIGSSICVWSTATDERDPIAVLSGRDDDTW